MAPFVNLHILQGFNWPTDLFTDINKTPKPIFLVTFPLISRYDTLWDISHLDRLICLSTIPFD